MRGQPYTVTLVTSKDPQRRSAPLPILPDAYLCHLSRPLSFVFPDIVPRLTLFTMSPSRDAGQEIKDRARRSEEEEEGEGGERLLSFPCPCVL